MFRELSHAVDYVSEPGQISVFWRFCPARALFSTLHRYISVVIIAVMLKAVFLIKNPKAVHSDAVTAEMTRTAEALREAGLISGILTADSAEAAAAAAREVLFSAENASASAEEALLPTGNASASAEQIFPTAGKAAGAPGIEETLFLCEGGDVLRELLEKGAYAIGYAHADNSAEHFSGAPYIVQEPDLVDADSYVKMYQRAAGLPWTILETKRCLVREFTEEDLDGIYALYDAQACRFLQPPSADRAREREILRAYIERIYGLYGFGHWAVFLKDEPEVLIGRIGYSAITSRQEQEAQALGLSALDADFGFLVGAKWRGQGIAEEVSRALLRYGFTELGFTCVRADARNDNAASQHLLTKLGFVPAGSCTPEKEGEAADKTLFIYAQKEMNQKEV